MILIVRNPKEVLLRHNHFSLKFTTFQWYFDNIKYFNNFKGNKMLLYYEDIFQKGSEYDIDHEMATALGGKHDEDENMVLRKASKNFFDI